MTTAQQEDHLSGTHDLAGKIIRNTAVAIWVYALSALLFAGLFGLAFRETGKHLTIVTVLYFSASSALLILLARLVTGRLLNVNIRVVTAAGNRTTDQETLRTE